MNYGEMLDWHRSAQAPISPSPPFRSRRRRPAASASLEIDDDYRVTGFEEKPQHGHPARSRFDPRMVSASMGIYVFNTDVLLRALHEDAQDPEFDATISART